ncbi:MAG: ABC transporter ATP-binding protein [Lentisphaeraceae bacterium]|nr:ABC transporter ATP-binding protein [Lentisphaeraceae bacterium]
MNDEILSVRDVKHVYEMGSHRLEVLKDVSFSIKKGTTVSIVGPSGSGKSTLLGLCAGLDQASSGDIELCSTNLSGLNEDRRAELRSRHIGFIFQAFQLLPTLTALENVMVPMELQGKGGRQVETRARKLLDEVGLSERLDHYPAQLSGGEQQRGAIARAFINQPEVLFADEPTGNLDSETGGHIEERLFEMNRIYGTTLILVTHNNELAARTDRCIRLKGGEIVEA